VLLAEANWVPAPEPWEGKGGSAEGIFLPQPNLALTPDIPETYFGIFRDQSPTFSDHLLRGGPSSVLVLQSAVVLRKSQDGQERQHD
jgi:hypothetical protein